MGREAALGASYSVVFLLIMGAAVEADLTFGMTVQVYSQKDSMPCTGSCPEKEARQIDVCEPSLHQSAGVKLRV